MLQLTKRTEYGLIAMVHLATPAPEPVSAREIAETYNVPRRLLAEVLKDLCREGLVESTRGAQGGYSLARPAEDVSVGQVVAALEGRPSMSSCESLGAWHNVTKSCDVEPRCPIRSPLHQIRDGIWRLMENTSLRSLANPSHTRTSLRA